MWVVKIELDGSESLLGSNTIKNNVTIRGYPLSHHTKDGKSYVYLAGEVFGEEKNVNKFISDLKKNKEILNLERKERFVVALVEKDSFFSVFYNPYFIFISPVIIKNDGKNIFEMGSFKREELVHFIDLTEKKYGSKLIYIKQKSIKDISIISPYPDVTPKQREIFEIALKEGYYEFPKRTSINKITKIKNISFSTCRTHLKKAEKKMLQFVFNYL